MVGKYSLLQSGEVVLEKIHQSRALGGYLIVTDAEENKNNIPPFHKSNIPNIFTSYLT